MGTEGSYPQTTRFNASLEGLRAVASIGVLLTHVAFQTGLAPTGFIGGILGRFDFFVPVFFTLSAFLLWRRYGPRSGRDVSWTRYLVSRVGRIFPAYLVVVAAVLMLLPDAYRSTGVQRVTNLTMTQIYVPGGLAPALTHLWSLCVEVAFYAALPLLAVVAGVLPGRARIPAIVLVAVVSLGWAWLPFVAASPAPGVANLQILPPAFTCWFAVGMIAAEVEGRLTPRPLRILGRRPVWWGLAVVTLWIAAQPWYGPVGLVHPQPGEFVLRVLAGTVFTAAVVLPYALAPREGLLTTPAFQALGRWSYSIFLVHLPVLELMFPLTGISPFTGHTALIAVLTLAVTVPVSAAVYVLVEEPARTATRQLVGVRQYLREGSGEPARPL
ncbi:acyltransferase [Corynebacterium sp. CCM 8835]|uniref:Acyltransferase n=1 Tax=Corynebacterium antarcticum TaxID=2800405 RepID=A0ABS1FIL9_9CORY|nr:acyltransferase [Corynebacterium antarcticum]MCK7643225.1 acyltransferase [Corynebacterium antarcticum]MCK7661728.1 acyltransferase [Corynebacterium antarcticum]MCL0246613.1 acyltransferase [Corynebacterium antarcticum]